MMERNLSVVLARRPVGEPREDDFRFVEGEVPEPREGEVLLRTRWLSLDPYMRGRMSAARSYAPPLEIGEVIVGATVSEVVRSRNDAFPEGTLVLANAGWQRYAISDGRDLRALDPTLGPPTYALGILGMPGQTAYCALFDIGRPRPGETVVVSAATGAVGSVAGQLAKIAGCRVVGVAGGPEKCRYAVDELGYDACIDRRAEDLDAALARHCPDGIDVYFDNTAGAILEAVLRRLNVGARMLLVGLIEHYNATEPPKGPYLGPLLVARARIEGFLVRDHLAHTPAFLRHVGGLVKAGRLRYREHVVDGLENAPRAFIGLLRGENFGKVLVRV